ncbi:MAG: 4-hydroxyphenylpyruvate dioxygenase, partial [Gammaproteobacteria bacterium]|nr:4-hydroxyphenylpyruvate dioxygenase [Gammaproteobacteria bacterium]
MSAQPNIGMRPTTFENPMGVDGFEFVEYAAPDAKLLHDLFPRLGFTRVARHKRRKISLYRQGACNFLVNEEPDSFAADFAKKHGPCACGFAIRFSKPAAQLQEQALAKGAEKITHKETSKAVNVPVIAGIGGSMLYLVDRYGAKGEVYDAEFEYLPGAERHPKGFGLTFIDHLTH